MQHIWGKNFTKRILLIQWSHSNCSLLLIFAQRAPRLQRKLARAQARAPQPSSVARVVHERVKSKAPMLQTDAMYTYLGTYNMWEYVSTNWYLLCRLWRSMRMLYIQEKSQNLLNSFGKLEIIKLSSDCMSDRICNSICWYCGFNVCRF